MSSIIRFTRITAFVGWACVFSNCAGEVHFISQENSAGSPPKREGPPEIVRDSFYYTRPSGAPIVAFVIYPRKSIKDLITSLTDSIDRFTTEFWKDSDRYESVQFGLARDSSESRMPRFSTGHYERSSWPSSSFSFLRQALTSFTLDFAPDEFESAVPFVSFQNVLSRFLEPMGNTELPNSKKSPISGPSPWLHLIYFKNADQQIFSEYQETLDQAGKRFILDLNRAPFSPFRYSVHLVSFLSAQAPCHPLPGRVATRLSEALSSYHLTRHELCFYMMGDLGASGSDLKSIAETIARDQRRMVLSRKPKLETLEIRINGGSTPREHIRMEPATNEMTFTEARALIVKTDDLIEVKYEAMPSDQK